MQMCGRAGRPPFDDTGMVIIMTRRETVCAVSQLKNRWNMNELFAYDPVIMSQVHLYENLLNGCEMVESQ